MNESSITQPLIAVVGQTASGKSHIAHQFARQFQGEIVAADSWTVRRGLDIGTAKPSVADRQTVPHYLIDIVEPCQDFSAAVFKGYANTAIEEIHGRNKLPLLVGGTGLYIDSVLFDYSFAPPGSLQERNRLNGMTIEELLALAQEEKLDTSVIDTGNKRRIIRLIETGGVQPQKGRLRPNTLVLGIEPVTPSLRERITERVDHMIVSGLEKEVENLANRYGWNCEGLKGIGYREWQEYFSGAQSVDIVRERIIQATMQLAKRQKTWFKRNPDILWCKDYDTALRQMYAFLD